MGNPWTPGPWVFYAPDSWSDGLGYVRPATADGREIAHHGDSNRSSAENLANARLIAAAPEMAEALEECANELYEMLDEVRLDRGLDAIPEHWLENHNKARAILARIRGDAPCP